MKKFLKVLALILVAFALILLILGSYIHFTALPKYADIPIKDITIDHTPENIALGKKLITANCEGCHLSDNGVFEGKRFEDEVANEDFGVNYASNITQHPTAGIKNYTDGELYRLFRTGVKKNGSLVSVVMPRLVLCSDEDIYNMIAYLKSDDKKVQPSDKVHPIHQPSFLEKALSKFVFKPIEYKTNYPNRPDLKDSVAYGEYMVDAVTFCYACHSNNVAEANLLEPKKTPNYLGGGMVFKYLDHEIEVPSIKMDGQSEVSKWTTEEFVKAVRFGVRPNKQPYQKPMHPYPMLEDAEIRAIAAYLKAEAQ